MTARDRKATRLAVAAAVSVAMLVACGSGDGDASSGTTGAGATTADGGTAADDVVIAPSTDAIADDTVPVPPSSEDGAAEDAPGVTPAGFTTVTVRLTEADGTTCDVCMWLADDSTERGRGLMGVTDLGAAAGMVFVFERPTSGSFFMFQTVTPLSIAWFDPAGELAATADMEPCTSTDSATCERYSPDAIYDVAIEVFQGDLAALGVTDGSSVEVLAGTEADLCPLD